MVLNGMDESLIAKHFSGAAQAFANTGSGSLTGIGTSDEYAQLDQSRQRTTTSDNLLSNAFVNEMAAKKIRDFKGRSRTNMVPRVAQRIRMEEKRGKDKLSVSSVTTPGSIQKKRKSLHSSIAPPKALSYEDIKQWNENYRLDGKSVYQLDAEFASLVKIQLMQLEEEIERRHKTVFTNEKLADQSKQIEYRLRVQLKEVTAENKVSLSVLIEFSDIKQDRFDDIMDRILWAFNIDPKDPNSRIDFDLYVRLKCLMRYYTIPNEELKKIWMRIINPSSVVSMPKEELQDLLERFSRGKIQSQKILVSATFSEQMIAILEYEGCTNPEVPEDILISSVLARLEDGTFDIELFNQMIKNECNYRVWSKNHEYD